MRDRGEPAPAGPRMIPKGPPGTAAHGRGDWAMLSPVMPPASESPARHGLAAPVEPVEPPAQAPPPAALPPVAPLPASEPPRHAGGASHSHRVVYAAAGANLAIAVTKFAAAAISGSAAMLSEAIHSVIDTFYTRIQADPILEAPFRSVKNWPHHIERLTHFWWIRLGGHPYQLGMYNPVEKHFLAGFNPALLKRWLALFKKTIEEKLSPKAAALWIEISEHMGEALSMKNEGYSAMMKAQSE